MKSGHTSMKSLFNHSHGSSGVKGCRIFKILFKKIADYDWKFDNQKSWNGPYIPMFLIQVASIYGLSQQQVGVDETAHTE